MRNPAVLVGKVVLIVTSLTAAAAATAGAAAATPAVVDRSAKLRSGPGPGYPILATLPRGSSVDVRGCRSGWCEIAWSGGRGYVGHNLLAPPTGVAPVVTLAPGPVYDDGYDYPGFDFPGIAYAPTFATVGPRWSHRRWSRLHQRPSFWRMPPQIGSAPPRLIGRAGPSGPAAGAESQFGTRPTVGSTFSDSAVPAARSTPAAAPDAIPAAGAETPASERR